MKKSKLGDEMKVRGLWKVVHKDKNGRVLSEETFENLITNEGKDYILDSSLNNQTSVADWFIEIFTDGTAAATHTYATPGRTAATTAISEALRQGWNEGASSSQSVTNATAATITANGSLTVAGFGIVGSPGANANDDTKGDTGCTDGVLLSDVDASKSLADSETLDITYTVDC